MVKKQGLETAANCHTTGIGVQAVQAVQDPLWSKCNAYAEHLNV